MCNSFTFLVLLVICFKFCYQNCIYSSELKSIYPFTKSVGFGSFGMCYVERHLACVTGATHIVTIMQGPAKQPVPFVITTCTIVCKC